MNKNIAILGSQHGDCGKAKIAHTFAPDFDYIIRFAGSSNAGHTLYHNGIKIVRHLIPSADFSSNNKAFLGAGMVINLEELLNEVQDTEKMFPGSASKIIVDPDAFVIFPHHVKEDMEKNKHIGSTNKGVSPCYRDKINRCGTKISKLINDNADIILAIKKLGVQFKHSMELRSEFEKSKLLFEGSQSILLDLSFGSYPYITSGECGLGGIYNAGFASFMPSKVCGIMKAYNTKVGEGCFPTEIFGEEADKLVKLGQEFGSTTGRKRRIGWGDLPALKYSIIKGGINSLIITKLDILNGYDKVPVCIKYDKVPICGDDFFTAKPHYINVKGWKDCRDFNQTKEFIHTIADYTGIKIEYISIGINKEDIIKL